MSELNSPLYQRVGEELRKINLETTASQVKTADGSTVETKLSALDAALSSQTGCVVVADIGARDAIANPKVGDQAWVKDATADATVSQGAAKYLYESAEAGWVKIGEAESLDVVLAWANLQDKPAAAVAEIDEAAAQRHEHANKADLDRLSISGGQVAVDAVLMKTVMVAQALPETAPSDLAEGGLLIVDSSAAA